jgi:peptidoglycan/xylan/chitin deacetylase (PgdA/CDA1 family)
MRLLQFKLLRKHYRIIMWDLVTRDYSKRVTAEDVVNNVKRYARNGSIITFHDSLKSIDKLQTALPEALQWLKDQGYAFKVIENRE